MQTSNTAEMVTISRAEYERFQEQAQVITSLTLQNEWLLEQLKLSKKKLFGRSSEQAEQMVMEQLSFTYNEAEAYASGTKAAAEKPVEVRAHARKRQSGNVLDVVPEGARTEVVEHRLPENERIWFALAAYNMGYAHMLDARALTAKTKGNPDSWADVKQRLPLLSQKPYYSKLTYGYARGHEAYAYVENIRKYQISLVGYLQEKEKQATEAAMQLAQDYPAVSPTELGKEKFPFLSFLSQSSSNYLTHSPSLLFSRKGSEEKQN